MRFGIIAEGTTDQAVLSQIIYGIAGKQVEIVNVRPELGSDSTDRVIDPVLQFKSFGGWQYVKMDCSSDDTIKEFYLVEDDNFIVVQLDTAELEQNESNIKRPSKTKDTNQYVVALRQTVVSLIDSWVSTYHADKLDMLIHAVAVEETESWLLTLLGQKEAEKSAKPKEKLKRELAKKGLDKTESAANYAKIAKPMSDLKELKRISKLNKSLGMFVAQLIEKLPDQKQS